ncbi:MAG: hypothetical protein DRI69_01040, partial [Bacteroidetes bacterium]
MKKLNFILTIYFLLSAGYTLSAQITDCNLGEINGDTTYTGTILANYGSVSNALNSNYRMTGAVGEVFIGSYFSQEYQGTAGFYGKFHLPPSEPLVGASEGDLVDRIQIDWEIDALSPSPELGFNIYRDGALIVHVDKDVRKYIDFNVLAGHFYTYEVAGVSQFGEGFKGSTLGFINPNGVVTGQIKTLSGNPVAGAEVTLSPTLGTALAFSGDDMAFVEANSALTSPEWTLSCWLKIGNHDESGTIFDYGLDDNVNWSMTVSGKTGETKFIFISVGTT